MENDLEVLLDDIKTSYNNKTPYDFQNISRDIGSKIFDKILLSLSTITDQTNAQQKIVSCDILKDLGNYLNGEGFDYTAYLNSGNIQFKAGYLEEAEGDFEKAISLLPSYGVNINDTIPSQKMDRNHLANIIIGRLIH